MSVAPVSTAGIRTLWRPVGRQSVNNLRAGEVGGLALSRLRRWKFGRSRGMSNCVPWEIDAT